MHSFSRAIFSLVGASFQFNLEYLYLRPLFNCFTTLVSYRGELFKSYVSECREAFKFSVIPQEPRFQVIALVTKV